MQFVEPIRDKKKIAQIKNTLKGEGKIRELLLFHFGIVSALRISDILAVKARDLYEENLTIKKEFTLKEKKTKKTQRITITPWLKDTLHLYQETYPNIIKNPNNYLFFHTKKSMIGEHHIGRKQAWKMIWDWCNAVWLDWRYGSHTLRKTWWYHARKKGIPIPLIQKKLNHVSTWTTLKYLGITHEELAKACDELDL